MTATLIGYARCSTDEQDLTAQRGILAGLGVAEDRVYLCCRRRVNTDPMVPLGF